MAMRILIISDAWAPQMNGVVRTLQATVSELEQRGHQVLLITPDQYRSVPCPTYPEIRLALTWPGQVGRRMADLHPDAIHIATEGPLGMAARRWCIRRRQAFTTAYHTQFPDYVAARTPISAQQVWRFIRWFHGPAAHILTATPSLRAELAAQGLTRLVHWGRGVDLSVFHPGHAQHPAMAALPRPIMLYVGRVSVEKNIEAFLSTDRPGSKVVVGDGPALAGLQRAYPAAHFLGALKGEVLAQAYASADVFVFPSRTDTFGLVMIEAMACGAPVAAYPVMGPIDIVTPDSGALDEDLGVAIDRALRADRAATAKAGAEHSWARATGQFLEVLVPAEAASMPPAAMAVPLAT
jgi:glycosyltransferase involved in cell wall biosynthesis